VDDGVDYNPTWIPKAAMGLIATSNSAPPAILSDFKDYRDKKDFRGMVFCLLHVEIDDTTDKVTVSSSDFFAQSGFTPPFSIPKLKGAGVHVGPGDEVGLMHDVPDDMQTKTIQGEASSVSGVVIGDRHPSSVLADVASNETVLVNGVAKLRASQREDELGVSSQIGVPFHVPWVWCEILVTYAGGRNFNIFGRGSTFPSHAWYFDDEQVATVPQLFDSRFPVLATLGGSKLINESAMSLTAFFRKGVPGAGPQTSLAAEAGLTGPVDQHPNTTARGTSIKRTVRI
jgi:hypothetical protein